MKKLNFSSKESLERFLNAVGKQNISKADDLSVEVTWDDVDQIISSLFSYIESELSWLSKRISSLDERLYRHAEEGHLPPIQGAGKLEGAMKKLGIDDDYDVKKRVVWAEDGTVLARYEKPKG